MDCGDFNDCGGRICVNGRCRGLEGCANDTACEDVLPNTLDPLICNDNNENIEAPDDVCILDPAGYFGVECDAHDDCDEVETAIGIEFSCVTNTCVPDCRDGGQEECDTATAQTGLYPGLQCVGGACILEATV